MRMFGELKLGPEHKLGGNHDELLQAREMRVRSEFSQQEPETLCDNLYHDYRDRADISQMTQRQLEALRDWADCKKDEFDPSERKRGYNASEVGQRFLYEAVKEKIDQELQRRMRALK